MLEKRRCWAWVAGYDKSQQLSVNEHSAYFLRPTMGVVAEIDAERVVEIPDAALLKRYKSDLRKLADATQTILRGPDANVAEYLRAIAVAQEIAPRYTTEACQ